MHLDTKHNYSCTAYWENWKLSSYLENWKLSSPTSKFYVRPCLAYLEAAGYIKSTDTKVKGHIKVTLCMLGNFAVCSPLKCIIRTPLSMSYQPIVTVKSCFIHKVIRDLYSIVIYQFASQCTSNGVYNLKFKQNKKCHKHVTNAPKGIGLV